MKRDCAFIKFSDPHDADDAQYDLDGRDVDGSRIIVQFARGVCFLEEQEAASPIADPDPAPRADVDEAMPATDPSPAQTLVLSRPSLPEPVCKVLADIRRHLESSSLKALVTNIRPIRGRYEEISSLLPDELAEALHPAAHIDFHRFGVMKALKRIADRAARDELKACIVSAEQHSREELEKLNEVKGRPTQIQTRLEQLRKERVDLQAALEAKDAEIQEEEASLARTDQVVKQQEAVWRSAMDRVLAYYNALSSAEIPGSDKDVCNLLYSVFNLRPNGVSVLLYWWS